MKFLKKIIKFIFLFIILIRNIIFFLKVTLKKKDNIKKIFFVPNSGKGWILEFLIKDLLSSNNKLNKKSIYANKLAKLLFFYLTNPSTKIVCFSYGFASYLINRGFPEKDLIVLFTHKKEEINPIIFNRFSSILFMNKQSKKEFTSAGLKPSKAYYFPIGYDQKKFNIRFQSSIKKYDLIVPMRYVLEDKENEYYERKNYKIVIPLLNKLSRVGINVCIVGKDWNKCKNLSKNITLLDLEHNQTPKIFNQGKFALCLSLIEGGFTGLLETLACGCTIISHKVGFANDLNELIPEKVILIGFLKSVDAYFEKIHNLIKDNYLEENYNKRSNNEIMKKLKQFQFETLSEKISSLN